MELSRADGIRRGCRTEKGTWDIPIAFSHPCFPQRHTQTDWAESIELRIALTHPNADEFLPWKARKGG